MKRFYLLFLTLVVFETGINAQVTVSGSANADGTYTSLTQASGAFAAILVDFAGETGRTILITITANIATEDGSTSLARNGAWNSLTISPSGGAARVVSGNVNGPLISLSRTNNVTIDGLNSGGNTLTFSNTNTGTSASTLRFIDDASNNTITRTNFLGSTTGLGTIYFSTGYAFGAAFGNDNNNINQCNISASVGGSPLNAIYSLGTSPAIDNSGNTISTNNISDFFNATLSSAGININLNNSGWTISNNTLYQTATRIYTAGATTHNGIIITSGAGYTISNNIIGFANPAGTGTTNMLGNTGVVTGTFPSSYTVAVGTAVTLRYIAINCAFTAAGTVSNIQGNTIAGFAFYTGSGASTTNGNWCAINVTAGNVNIGTTTGNTIGATTGNSSVYDINTNGGGAAVGIFVTSANTVSIQNNTIGAIDAVGATTTFSGAFTGIDVAGAGVFTVSSNTIGNSTTDNIRTGYTLSGGNLSNAGTLTSTTGTTSPMVGIRSAATGATISITSNTLRGWVNGTTNGGVLTGITNTGAASSAVTISNNLLGTAGLGWMRYAFAGIGTITGINATGLTAAAALSISSNDFRGITYSVSGTGSNTYINWSHAGSVTDNLNSNTFTNLNVKTTGTVSFFARAGNMTATGIENVNNNSIVTGFNKGSAGGSINLYNAAASSVLGSQMNETGNNFSNITYSGATIMNGWSNLDGVDATSGPTKTITGNTFSNWTGGTGNTFVLSQGFGNNNTNVSSNTISNITTNGVILGIAISTTNGGAIQTFSSNTITNLTSNAPGGTVNGIQGGATGITTQNVTGNTITGLSQTGGANQVNPIIITTPGATVNIAKNKIGNIQSDNAGGNINGIAVTGGNTCNIYNNLIGDLRTPSATGLNAISGISVSGATTYNVYYNSIYLNASSSSVTTFGTSCIIFFSTVTTLDLRNNILYNSSTPAQEGLNIATNGISAGLRRNTGTGGTVPANYATTSDNNDYWVNPTAGTNNHLTYVEGNAGTITNPQNTVANMKIFMINRDQLSLNVIPNFVSTSDLHLVANSNCGLDGYGTPIVGITTDYDNQTRDITTPDIGADEFTATYSGILAGIAGSAVCENKNVSTSGTTYANSSCDLIATILPSGGVTAVSGKVNVCVTLQATQQYFNAEPYLQRHFDIEPASNASTSTGTVTLYFYDAEFVNFNNNNPSWPKLPTSVLGNADPNRANLKVTQYHGTATTSPSTPGYYSAAAGTGIYINPTDANIVWNGSYWAVTFNVTGFSGFYVHTNPIFPLPISVNYFRGTRQGNTHLLDWKVTCNSTPSLTVTLERNASPAGGFSGINTTTARAARCNQPFNYTDLQPLNGMNYYRLRMVDADGKISYSTIVALLNAAKGFEIMNIAPNPVTGSTLKLDLSTARATKMELIITDMTGRVVKRQQVSMIAGFNSIDMNVGMLAAGTYNIYGTTVEDRSGVVRFVKQ